MTERVREILSWYSSDNPGTRANLARMLHERDLKRAPLQVQDNDGRSITVVPDGCVEDTRGSTADPCPENCARCVCCARLPIFIPQIESPASDVLVTAVSLPPIQRSTISTPQTIFHVPKAL